VKFLCLLAALKHQIAYDILKLSCHCSFLTERSWSKSRIASCRRRLRPKWSSPPLQGGNSTPQGLKPALISAFSARLKPCP